MTKQWIIHKNGKTLGPWKAERIKQALRGDEICLTDMVSAENSPEMKELIEVSEIFQTNPSEETNTKSEAFLELELSGLFSVSPQDPEELIAKKDDTATIKDAPVKAPPLVVKPTSSNLPFTDVSEAEPEIYNNLADRYTLDDSDEAPNLGSYMALADPKIETKVSGDEQQNKNLTTNRQRKYFLISAAKKKSGPYSSKEIKSLYMNGKISRKVKVKILTSDILVPIEKFIATILSTPKKTTMTRVKSSNNITQLLKRTEAILQPQHSSSVETDPQTKLLRAFFAVSLAIFAMVSIIGYKLYNTNNQPMASKTAPQNTTRKVRPTPSKVRPTPSKVTESKQLNYVQPSKITTKLVKPKYKAPTFKRSYKPISRRRPQVALRRRKTGNNIQAAKYRPNGVMTLGPLSFNIGSLNNCQVKCEIPMSDSKGDFIIVKFFKKSFYSKLLRDPKNVYIRGQIADGGNTIFLQSIQ